MELIYKLLNTQVNARGNIAANRSNASKKQRRFLLALADKPRHLNIFDQETAFNKQKSAQFRYVSNDISDESSLSASGAIFWNSDYDKEIDQSNLSGTFNRYGFSATFNRLRSDNIRRERNSLDFRATYFWSRSQSSTNTWHSFSTSLIYSTDFNFLSETNGLETEYSLQSDHSFLGNPSETKIGVFEIDVQPGLIWAKVSRPQIGSQAEAGDEYLAAGGTVEFNFWPQLELFGAKPSLNAEYVAFGEILGERDSSELWKLTFEYPLSTHISLTARRETGVEYVSQNQVQNTVIGLGVKL